MDYMRLKEFTSPLFLFHIYEIARTEIFKLLLGKNWKNRLSKFPKIEKAQNLPRDRFFSYYVRYVGGDLVQSKIPEGVILQPLDSLSENYAIHRSRIFDIFYKIQNNDVVIDIGAHVGIFTLRAAQKARNGLVVAVEPYLPNYKLLMYNINYNKIENVIAINCALSESTGVTKLYIGTESLSHTTSKRRKISNYVTERYVKVKTQTLDGLVDKLKLRKVNFVKINAEGAELSILKGAEKTLEKNNVSLALAVDHYPTEIQEVSKYLQRKGYAVFPYGYMNYLYATKEKKSFSSTNH